MSTEPTGTKQYPGVMTKYPDQVKGAGPAWVHDCFPGCPQMPKRMPISATGMAGGPPSGLKPQFPGAAGGQLNPGQTSFAPPLPDPNPANLPHGVRLQGPGLPPIGMDGQPVWLHPHYPQFKADFCKTCNHVVPIRPPKLSKKLSKQEIEDFKECFQMFDKDGDGTIGSAELGPVMRSLGQNPEPDEIEEMIDEADADGSGSINFPEFIELMLRNQSRGQTKDEIKQAFRVFDKDGNGYVGSSEIRFVMSKLGLNFTDDELNEMVLEADIDGDTQVCFEEFYNMLTAD